MIMNWLMPNRKRLAKTRSHCLQINFQEWTPTVFCQVLYDKQQKELGWSKESPLTCLQTLDPNITLRLPPKIQRSCASLLHKLGVSFICVYMHLMWHIASLECELCRVHESIKHVLCVWKHAFSRWKSDRGWLMILPALIANHCQRMLHWSLGMAAECFRTIQALLEFLKSTRLDSRLWVDLPFVFCFFPLSSSSSPNIVPLILGMAADRFRTIQALLDSLKVHVWALGYE